MYKIEYNSDVIENLNKIPINILIEIYAYFKKYEINPYSYSQPLYNLYGIDLRGYRKTYIANAAYRIIIKVTENTAKIVSVIAVGERDNFKVYQIANNRVNK